MLFPQYSVSVPYPGWLLAVPRRKLRPPRAQSVRRDQNDWCSEANQDSPVASDGHWLTGQAMTTHRWSMEDQDSHPAGDMDKTNISEETSGVLSVSSNQPEATTVSLYQGNYLHLISSSIYHIPISSSGSLSGMVRPSLPATTYPTSPSCPMSDEQMTSPPLYHRGSPTYNLKLYFGLSTHMVKMLCLHLGWVAWLQLRTKKHGEITQKNGGLIWLNAALGFIKYSQIWYPC